MKYSAISPSPNTAAAEAHATFKQRSCSIHYKEPRLHIIIILVAFVLQHPFASLHSPPVSAASESRGQGRSNQALRQGGAEHFLPLIPRPLVFAESEVTTVNRCLDAAKACNIDETCQKLRTEYVSACIQPSARSGPCNRPKCNKALRKFFDRVPPDYTHELLFCPCTDTACAERRRQTIVPSCSYEDKEKPNCLAQLRICKSDYVCR